MALLERLKLAIDARAASGIEDEWRLCTNGYEGKDETADDDGWRSKPVGKIDPKRNERRSVIIPNITRPFVDAAAAKIADIILPSDDRAWSLKPTPVPTLIATSKAVVLQDAVPGMKKMGVPPEVQQGVVDAVAEAAKEAELALKKAAETAEKAEKQIEDWQVESRWNAETRRVIDDMCRMGTGILKGPYPHEVRRKAWVDGKVEVKVETVPYTKRIDCWDFFPGAGCGENHRDGNDCWERTRLSKRALAKLKDQKRANGEPLYIAEAIDAVLAEGPITIEQAIDSKRKLRRTEEDDKALFDLFIGHCFAGKEDFQAAGCPCDSDTVQIPAIVEMVNGRVIKLTLNPLESGEFPYDVIPFQRIDGSVWGKGVANHGRAAQNIVTAAWRALLTNAARAAGPMLVGKANVVPANGKNEFVPWSFWYANDDDETDDARKLLAVLTVPDMQESLMNIINAGMKLFEDSTGLPLLLQGQSGSAPETLGGQQLVDHHAAGVLRRIARQMDDCITEPNTLRYYEYLLMHGPDECKGEFIVDARGSTNFAEREIYRNELQEYLKASLNPAFDLSPAKIMEEMLRVTKRSPDKLKLTADEKKALQEAQQGPQKPDNAIQLQQMKDADAKAEREFKSQEAEKERRLKIMLAENDRDIALMGYATQRNISLDNAKKDLAKVAMTLKVQREMGDTSVAKPIAEPKPRAKPGKSFVQ